MDLSYFNSPLLSLKVLKHSLRQCFMSTLVSSLLMNPSQLVKVHLLCLLLALCDVTRGYMGL